jgi:exodeoxyribonuclease-1
MALSYFFYDLETSGLNPREAKIMQFAGIRTDEKLNVIGESYDYLIKITNDCLPSIQAILVTGITPQMTIADGLTESEFLKIFNEQIALPDTVFVGYNNIRFDDEFIRFSQYRNFYEPYEWHYKDGRKRWDLLDVVRMTRALRPAGIKWPKDLNNKQTNKLTDITDANSIEHVNAHDALADVMALIQVAKLIKANQPKLFTYLSEKMPDKNFIDQLIHSGNPLVFTSGIYPSKYSKTTAVVHLADAKDGAVLLYDLRQDPNKFVKLSVEELKKMHQEKIIDDINLPIYTIRSNKCPALAPISVLNEESQELINLKLSVINAHLEDFIKLKSKLSEKFSKVIADDQKYIKNDGELVDAQLYDNFLDKTDVMSLGKIRDTPPSELSRSTHTFNDSRLNNLVLLYKARNYPKYLTDEEFVDYEKYRQKVLFNDGNNSRFAQFINELNETAAKTTKSEDQYLLEELKLYAESIMPSDL